MTYEDSQKLHSLYELYEQPMYRIAFAVLHSSSLAEDAVSDAFVTVIRHLHKFKEPVSYQYIQKKQTAGRTGSFNRR